MSVTPSAPVSGYCHEECDMSHVTEIFPGKLNHFKVTHQQACKTNALVVNLTFRFSLNFKENNVTRYLCDNDLASLLTRHWSITNSVKILQRLKYNTSSLNPARQLNTMIMLVMDHGLRDHEYSKIYLITIFLQYYIGMLDVSIQKFHKTKASGE